MIGITCRLGKFWGPLMMHSLRASRIFYWGYRHYFHIFRKIGYKQPRALQMLTIEIELIRKTRTPSDTLAILLITPFTSGIWSE